MYDAYGIRHCYRRLLQMTAIEDFRKWLFNYRYVLLTVKEYRNITHFIQLQHFPLQQ